LQVIPLLGLPKRQLLQVWGKLPSWLTQLNFQLPIKASSYGSKVGIPAFPGLW